MAVRITRSGVWLTVGIIILGLLVLGGLYIVKQRGEQARREDAIEVARENLESETQDGALTPSQSESENGESPQREQSSANESAPSSNPAPTELPATGPTEVFSLLAVGMLAFATTSYFRSRQLLMPR
jgi:LPXTG-motif cell wall-anchored protein